MCETACPGCIDELLAAFLEFPGVDEIVGGRGGGGGGGGGGAVVRSKVPIQDTLHINVFCLFVCLFELRLYDPVNNFSVMSGRSHRFLGITSTFLGGKCILLKDTTR